MNTENLDKALVEFGTNIVDEMRVQEAENNSGGTGNLSRSIVSNVITLPNNQGEKLEISLLWYGELLEDGGPARKAGRMPPITPIENWIRRKNISVPSKFKTPKSFAFAIAKGISKRGVKKYPKKPFIVNSINNEATNFGNKAITDGAELDIIEDINKQFMQSGATIS